MTWDFSAFMMGAEQMLSLSTDGLKKMNYTIMSIWLLIASLLVILNKVFQIIALYIQIILKD
jgi:hypothetical protein